MPGGEALLDQPGQPGRRDRAVAQPALLQHLGDRTHGAGGAQRLRPALGAEGGKCLLELGARGHLRRAEGLGREPALAEVAHGQAHRADREGLCRQRLAPLAQDQLRRSPADVDDQARLLTGLQVGHAGVDQARLFAPGDDLDREAQHALRALQELVAVGRLAQRLGGHGAHARRRQRLQMRRELLQALQPALRGLLGQPALLVEPGPQPDGLLQVLHPPVAAADDASDLDAEAVGTDVDGGEQIGARSRGHGRHRVIVHRAAAELPGLGPVVAGAPQVGRRGRAVPQGVSIGPRPARGAPPASRRTSCSRSMKDSSGAMALPGTWAASSQRRKATACSA